MKKWRFRIAFGLLVGYSILTTVLVYGFAGACSDLLAADQDLVRVATAERDVIERCLPETSSDACRVAVTGLELATSGGGEQ
jgi:hypothetical protein